MYTVIRKGMRDLAHSPSINYLNYTKSIIQQHFTKHHY